MCNPFVWAYVWWHMCAGGHAVGIKRRQDDAAAAESQNAASHGNGRRRDRIPFVKDMCHITHPYVCHDSFFFFFTQAPTMMLQQQSLKALPVKEVAADVTSYLFTKSSQAGL